ncbi:MAG: TraR/DksA family transcriptional regulator [Desulfosalsimonas sp.]
MREDIDLDYFENRLKKRLEEINASLEKGKESSGPVELDQARVGRVSRMDAMQQQAMTQAARRLSSMEKMRIQRALDRIGTGDYGFCLNCEEDIPEKRLRIDSSVMLCVECAREAENG